MQRRPTDTENKLLLLYAIDRLNAVTAQQLLSFMVENDIMDYISLQLLLAELVDADMLRRRKHAIGTLYSITRAGLDALEMFHKRLPHSRLAAVEAIAEGWRLRFRREKQMLADFTEAGHEFEVHLRLLEWDADLLDMRLTVPTRRQAQHFCDMWTSRAPNVYAYIMHTLAVDKEDTDGKTGDEDVAQ